MLFHHAITGQVTSYVSEISFVCELVKYQSTRYKLIDHCVLGSADLNTL